jgi:hypothetical protein
MDLEGVIAILRDYGMHEPDCPYRQVERARLVQGWSPIMQGSTDCTCWLAEHNGGFVFHSDTGMSEQTDEAES